MPNESVVVMDLMEETPQQENPNVTPAGGLKYEDLDPDFGNVNPPASDLGVKLEGEGVPEEFRGKTAAELIAYNKALAESLRISEQARDAEKQRPIVVQAAPPAEAPKPVQQMPEYPTQEQINQYLEQNPTAGPQVQLWIAQITEQRAAIQAQNRIAPMLAGHSSSAEALARQKYPLEFELFGDEILKGIRAIPDQSLAANLATWDSAVAFIRGSDGNIEKWQEKKNGKTIQNGIQQQQRQQQAANPGHFTANQRGVQSGGAPQLDDATLAIIAKMAPFGGPKTPEEYIKWKNN